MRTAVALLVLLVVAAPAPSLAEKPREAARKHFAEGKRLQETGDYERAIAEYQVANTLAPHPELIFNIGQCQRLKGDKPAAVASYKRYLVEAPRGRAAAEATDYIASLERTIAEEEAARRPAPPPEPTPPPAPLPVVEAPAPLAAPDAPHPGRTLRIAGLATAGGGALLLATGVVFALRASSIAGDVDALDERWDPDLYASGQRAETTSIVLLSAGAAAAVTGGVLYWLGVRAARVEKLTVVPVAGGAALRVSF